MQETIMDKAKATIRTVWDMHVMGEADDDSVGLVGLTQGIVDGQKNKTIHTIGTGVHGVHNILQYDQYDEKTGLFYNDNSLSFCFEVVPQTGADEDMASRLTTLFTPIPPGYGVQWTLFGVPSMDEQFDSYQDLRHIAVDQGVTTPFFVELAKRRIEHVKRSVGRPMFENDNFFIKNLRLVFSVTKQGASNDNKLLEELTELRETVRTSLRTANLPCFAMDAQALIRFVWPILNPETMFSKEPQPKLEYDPSKSIKEQVTAFGQHVKVKAKEVLFGLPPEEEGEADNRVAMRGFGVLQYPQKKELWEMVNIIGSFFDDGLQYPCPFIISGGVYTLDPLAVENKAALKSARAKQNAKSKMAEFQPELESQRHDWEVVMQQLNQGGSMCELYHTLVLFAPRKTINKATQIAVNVWRSERFFVAPLQSLHMPCLYASLPMTLTESMREDLVRFRVLSTKTTVNAVDLAPVIGEWRGAGKPVMMFLGVEVHRHSWISIQTNRAITTCLWQGCPGQVNPFV